MNRTNKILVTALTTCMLMVSGAFGTVADAAKKPVVAEGLQGISVKGSTDLPGHFFLSFAFSRNLIMLDGKGNIVWSKHEAEPKPGGHTGWWDFKKHKVKGKTYYSYHDQTGAYDNYGLLGYAPGERVISCRVISTTKCITSRAMRRDRRLCIPICRKWITAK